jgi:hypothetical protein
MNAAAKSMALLRREGLQVEHSTAFCLQFGPDWHPFAEVVDLVAVDRSEKLLPLAVKAVIGPAAAEACRDVWRLQGVLRCWLRQGPCRLEIHEWNKQGGTWQLTRRPFVLEDMDRSLDVIDAILDAQKFRFKPNNKEFPMAVDGSTIEGTVLTGQGPLANAVVTCTVYASGGAIVYQSQQTTNNSGGYSFTDIPVMFQPPVNGTFIINAVDPSGQYIQTLASSAPQTYNWNQIQTYMWNAQMQISR